MREIGRFVLELITGVLDLQAERDNFNGPARELAPPVTPRDLATLRPFLFRKNILDRHVARLRKFWPDQDITLLETQHQNLFKAYRDDPDFRAILDAHDHTVGFNTAWDSISQPPFNVLRRFAGGLAIVFADTTSVESDFSILKWEKDEFRSCLMDITLEGIFQAKQFNILIL